MNHLFDIPECPSPRLRWMEKHGIRTSENPDANDARRWFASNGEWSAYGATQDDALVALAKAANLKLWNEE